MILISSSDEHLHTREIVKIFQYLQMNETPVTRINESHARSVLESVESCLRSAQFLDTVLTTDTGHQLRCHRLVLTSASPLLEQVLRDQDTEEDATIIMPGVRSEEVDTVLHYLYTGQTSVTGDHEMKLFHTLNIPVSRVDNSESSCQQQSNYGPMTPPSSCPPSQIFDNSQDISHSTLKFRDASSPSTIINWDNSKVIMKTTENKNDKNFRCQKCSEKFRWKAEYKRHMEAKHGEVISDTVPCSYCNKQIVSKRLNEHIKTVHQNTKSLSCSQCDKKFSKPSELRNHQRTHTGERPFVCDVCNAAFAYNHILLRHKKYHDGAKQFKCQDCGKSFLQKNDLIKHGRIHTGEKPYNCDVCGKGFARMDYLKKHQLLHSADTKFCCNDCGELCGSLDGLKKHSLSHKPSIELNSFEDLALQLPGLEMETLQAVSLDGGKTIMILPDTSINTTSQEPSAEPLTLSSSSTASTAELVLTQTDSLDTETSVLYAVRY